MPTVDYTCKHCRHSFRRVVLLGDEELPATCPQCHKPGVRPSPGPTRLTGGMAPVSSLAQDTN